MMAPAHMTPGQLEAYCAFLQRVARKAHGLLRQRLEAILSDLNPWGFTP